MILLSQVHVIRSKVHVCVFMTLNGDVNGPLRSSPKQINPFLPDPLWCGLRRLAEVLLH